MSSKQRTRAENNEKIDYVSFDYEKSLSTSLENHWFFRIFFPLKYLFLWVAPVLFRGYRNPLTLKDVPDLTADKKTTPNLKRFQKWWDVFKNFKKNRLFYAITMTFILEFTIAGILAVIAACGQVDLIDSRTSDAKSMAVLSTIFFSMPTIMSTGGFITYYLVNGVLDPITIFTSLSYINMLQFSVTMVPMILVGTMESLVSYSRIEKLLVAEELQPRVNGEDFKNPIVIEHGNFKWEAVRKGNGSGGAPKSLAQERKERIEKFKKKFKKKEDELVEQTTKPFELQDISLSIKRGDLVMIIGNVGSGKSSLLQAMLSEMKKTCGNVQLSGSVAYCAQTPWIQNATLLDNVLFGKPHDAEKFNTVVDVCSLSSDLEILKGGKMIEIGEKGINLSGGQKYRVSLARAVYSDSDIYLLDDPLAAVDPHVGRSIFEKCIVEYLEGKTRVLVTHQLQICEHADLIVLMDDGKMVECGNYNDLMAKKKEFYSLITENLAEKSDSCSSGEESYTGTPEERKRKRNPKNEKKEGEDKKEELIQSEEKARGMIGFDVIRSYVSAGGGWLWFAILVGIFVITQVALTGNNWFLSEWSAGTFNEEFGKTFTTNVSLEMQQPPPYSDELLSVFNTSRSEDGMNMTYFLSMMDEFNASLSYYNDEICPGVACFPMDVEIIWDLTYSNGTKVKDGLTQVESLSIFAGIGLGGVFLTFFRDLAFYMFCFVAAKVFHDLALKKIAFSPMKFFDTTPIGRILNRFSTDFEVLDFRISRTLSMLISMLLNCVGVFGLMGYATSGLFLPFLIPLGVIYVLVYFFYRKSVVELQRLNSISKSPLLSHLSETLNGTSTIRSFDKVEEFERGNVVRIDVNNSAYYMMMSAQRWLVMRLYILGFGIVVVVSAICILLMFNFEEWATSNISYISMGVSYSLSVSMLLSMVFTQLTEAEVLMNSVERVNHYAKNLEQEENSKGAECRKSWPEKGEIRFENYYMKYREGLPFVLRDINCTISAGERIGICGKTGSGKSSLMAGLFRMCEPMNGTIFIDDVDIRRLGLQTLRRGIAIIPQEAVMFMGTIRSNLDPFGEYRDHEILDVLEKASIRDLAGGLDGVVNEGGENFSAGQRQLLCLARALLKNSRILVLDECTASVDVNTDKIIQETIRQSRQTTILTIAHRINTIIDYDRILVMDNGKIGEFDSPKALLSDSKYHLFKDLVEETGQANAEHLRRIVFGEEIVSIGQTKVEEISGYYQCKFKGNVMIVEVNDEGLVIGKIKSICYKDVVSFGKFENLGNDPVFEIGDGSCKYLCQIAEKDARKFESEVLRRIKENEDESED